MYSTTSRSRFISPLLTTRILISYHVGYYAAYKLIPLPCISFIFIEIKLIYFHSCVMFEIKFMSIYNDYVNYDEIII